ncbi:hypothetical protein [Rahnella aceris]|nr:hypothetical protein [Rahnella aceris]
MVCVLSEQACQQHIQVAYYRLTLLLDDLNIGQVQTWWATRRLPMH